MNINELITETLQSLKNDGMTPSTLCYYKSSGFGSLRLRHEELGYTEFSYELCDELIHELRVDFENGTLPKHQWRVIRRCAVVMKSYLETGATKLPNLGKWEWLNAPYRVKPTTEQFADSENIFAIVWNTERELEKNGMPKGSLMRYTYGGFDKILKHFISVGASKYDEEIINDFVSDSYKNIANKTAFQKIRKCAALIIEYKQTGRLKFKTLERIEKRKLTPYFDSVIVKFKADNERKNKWSPSSAFSAYNAVECFLAELESMGFYDFENVTLKTISDCISLMGVRYTSGLKPTLSYIRAFLRFVAEQNISTIDLVKAIPKSVSLKRAVYSGFSEEEIKKMLMEVDVSTPQGKRDYAILQLGIKTGIRAIDVVKLKRQDIDWRSKAINIVQSKTNQPLGIPLSTGVGNAVADYLLKGRPPCESPNIFIRTYYPARPLCSSALSSIVKKYFRKAGLNNTQNRPIGFHTLRRTFGAHLLKAGTPVDMIGELLGVLDINSVQPYLAANEEGLKSCAISLVPLTLAKGDAV